MIWFKIAWRNLWRNGRRTAIQLSAIAGGMFLAVFFNSFSDGLYVNMIDSGVRSGSGHVGLYQEHYLGDRKVADTVPADALLAQLEHDPDVVAVYPRVQIPGLLRSSRDSRPVGAIGLDFDREAKSNPLLDPKVIVEGTLPKTPNGLLIGEGLAKELKVKVGKKVVWMAQDAHGEIASQLFRVSGIVRTHVHAVDANAVIGPRATMARVIGREGSAHEIGVMLKSPDAIPTALPRLRAIATSMPGVKAYPWQEAMPGVATIIEMGNAKQRAITFILFALIAVGTLNTMLMSVMERTREFGVIRAMGVSKGAIRQMVLAEGAILGLIGSVLGIALVALLNVYTSRAGIDLSKAYGDLDMGIAVDYVIRTVWNGKQAAALTVGMFLLSIVATLYPARWALKIRPADAMRQF